ncbi:hypothetical protein N7466_007647 [Penicillium verhagenii]|uniref:uncharacterized protein n=1 Tax=Penicillium verhagenii TaxID=1562060 RepID=UPI0025458CDE|nr:uncharacterized protein N7466_007647 [Penicillium verhagenii]KAJ5928691.1 hypothetical protein N7466_007647 [Penicillium verhagenii]
MGWFDNDSEQADAANQWDNTDEHHEASFSHELLAGAASFAAARAYENHVAQNGAPPNHAMAKELMAGFAGAFIDREVETKGLDFVDRERAKRHANQQIEEVNVEEFNYN